MTLRNVEPLKLHIPQPRGRPGDPPDFSYLILLAPGEARRPEIDTPASEIRDLAFSLVRVLTDEGEAIGPWNPDLPSQALLSGLRSMLLTRAYYVRLFMC